MSWRKTIEDHYRAVWGVEGVPAPLPGGPIHELPGEFSVLALPPRAGRDMWTYATCCMAQPGDARPIELHIFSPRESREVVELLVATAHYHRTGSRLDLGHTVNFGRPWLDDSGCEFGLISLPYLDGPSLENLELEAHLIKFYWLIPVSSSEVDYKKQNGLDALEDRFDRAGFNYLDPGRTSVA